MKISQIPLYFAIFCCPTTLANEDYRPLIQKGLNYLERTQVKESEGIQKFKGEWGSYEVVVESIPRIGKKGYAAYDSNLFTTASIGNILAEIYLDDSTKNQIPNMLDLALENMMLYKNGDSFNFWQELPVPKNLIASGKTAKDYPQTRRGNNFHLKGHFLRWTSNVVNDGDDTALAYTGLYLYKQINGSHPYENLMPSKLGTIFSNYRDTKKRNNISFYNLRTIGKKRTGGFLTWHAKEKSGLNPFKFLPTPNRPYMPFGTNDVDCVINSNILATLAQYDELESTEGVKASCDFINDMFKKNLHRKCGVYYPNYYHFHYTTSKAIKAGATCLAPAKNMLVKDILKTQNKNGSFPSIDKLDITHATANALASLLNIKSDNLQENQKIDMALDKGVTYLNSKKIESENEVYWKGGIFFSGGRVFREKVYFISDEYTTALITYVLYKYENR